MDFPTDTRLHVVDEPQPNSIFLIAAEDAGDQGCVGRNEFNSHSIVQRMI